MERTPSTKIAAHLILSINEIIDAIKQVSSIDMWMINIFALVHARTLPTRSLVHIYTGVVVSVLYGHINLHIYTNYIIHGPARRAHGKQASKANGTRARARARHRSTSLANYRSCNEHSILLLIWERHQITSSRWKEATMLTKVLNAAADEETCETMSSLCH